MDYSYLNEYIGVILLLYVKILLNIYCMFDRYQGQELDVVASVIVRKKACKMKKNCYNFLTYMYK